MITVIVCSINPQLLAAVKQNIAETIGCPFDVIAVDNRGSTAGISEVYNSAAAQARFDLLCFMHEDIILQTRNWGYVVAELLKAETGIGLIGVAGSYYKTLSPSGWGDVTGYTDCMNIVQGFKNKGPEEYVRQCKNLFDKKYTEVAVLDGVWLCTTKIIAQHIRFDQQTFAGFHCYDLDFSLRVGQQYKVVVTYDVLLTHLSEGSYTRTWMMETIKLHEKWKNYLPVLRSNLIDAKRLYLEKQTFRDFLRLLIHLNLPLSLAKNLLWQRVYVQKMGLPLWLNMNFHLYKTGKKATRNTNYLPKAYQIGE
ncbi:glycosyltransferase [Mucilaginibacter sp. CSA2-8R]|uniref:glycosyltransferase n=1 Tax=Mucilaginibacter sp. CSA2-8R TaxID=3141542 RepID=UPI00315D7EFB